MMLPKAPQKWVVVLGLALGLPSVIVGTFFLLYTLVQKQMISWSTALIILLLVIGNALYLLVKNGMVKKDRQ